MDHVEVGLEGLGRYVEQAVVAIEAYLAGPAVRTPVIVAVDGGAGAGKSTLAWQVAGRIPDSQVVSVDSLFRPGDDATAPFLAPNVLRTEVLEPLRAGNAARYVPYDWARRTDGDEVRTEPSGVILIDGTFTLRPELRPYWDVTLFVDAPEAVRRERLARTRPAADPGWAERWFAAEAAYFASERPFAVADVVISAF